MKYFHTYDKRYLTGLEKNGFIGRSTGFKLQHAYCIDEKDKFNLSARKGGEVWSFITENGFPFYIDRLQGGVFYHKYSFDCTLLSEYEKQLDEWFLGVQMHETASVLMYDQNRITAQLKGVKKPWSAAQIREGIAKVSKDADFLHLSCGTPEEYEGQDFSQTYDGFADEISKLFKKRSDEVGGYLFPCDAAHLSRRLEKGARQHMVECGAQIPFMRIQVALTRGMAHAGKWGVYYEPWGGEPLSAPKFTGAEENEWHLTGASCPFDFYSYGENGGSSRLLQKRIYWYTWLSGADFLSEEWGISNMFSELCDYTLSAYGRAAKEFSQFLAENENPMPFVPFALVLPKEFSVVDLLYIEDKNQELCAGRIPDKRIQSAREILNFVYARTAPCGNEGHVITTSRFGDLFDVIYEDDDKSGYEACFDCTSINAAQLEGDVKDLSERLLPFAINGGLHFALAQKKQKWLVGLFANEGIMRSGAKGDVQAGKPQYSSLTFNDEVLLETLASNGEISIDRTGNTYNVAISPGGFVIFEFNKR